MVSSDQNIIAAGRVLELTGRVWSSVPSRLRESRYRTSTTCCKRALFPALETLGNDTFLRMGGNGRSEQLGPAKTLTSEATLLPAHDWRVGCCPNMPRTVGLDVFPR